MRLSIAAVLLSLPLTLQAQTSEDRIKALEERLNKLEGAPAKTSQSAFNPSMGASVDFAASHTNGKANVNVRAAEISIEAPIDPFVKGWTVLTGAPGGVEVEEAALQTMVLPYSLTITGGRLFASFGRLGHFHDHELPVIDRPRSLDTFIGGETQADGLEVSYLFPTPFYLNATGGVYNKLGGDNARADNAVERPLDNFTYLGRLSTYADLGDDHNLELGLSESWTPKRFVADTAATLTTRKNTWRSLAGVDLTYRYQPSSGGLYKGAVWGTEVMQNNERRFDSATNLPTDRVRAYAGYSYIQLRLGRRLRPGLMVDLTEDLDTAKTLTRTYTAFLTCDVTEFQRLRLTFARVTDNLPTGLGRNTVGVQWTGVLGHHVHGFRDR
jgi:hypothetical protein